MSRGRKEIINNTKLMMNIFSYLEPVDLLKTRNLNSTGKLLSDYFIKIGIHRDRQKSKSVKDSVGKGEPFVEVSDLSARSANKYNDTCLVRMKFLQLWNIYTNTNNASYIDLYDTKLTEIIKVVLFIIASVKDCHHNDNVMINMFDFDSDLCKLLNGIRSEFGLSHHNGGLKHGNCTTGEGRNVAIHPYNCIQEFFRNENIWKCIAFLSGYNLSNAELVDRENGDVIDYYLWPEKVSQPPHCFMPQNSVDLILSRLSNMSDVNSDIKRQIHLLTNKSKLAELNFYSSNGFIVDKTNVNLQNDSSWSFCDRDPSRTDFLSIQSKDSRENAAIPMSSAHSPSPRPCSPLNEEIFNSISVWIINILKAQKRLPSVKTVPRNGNSPMSLPSGESDKPGGRHDQNNTEHINSTCNHCCHSGTRKSASSCNRDKAPCGDYLHVGGNHLDKHRKIGAYMQAAAPSNANNSRSSDLFAGESRLLPETLGKLYGVVKSQESLLSELKCILNTFRR